MQDFAQSIPVRTQNNGDIVVRVADATTPTDVLKVNTDGSINVVTTATSLDIRPLAFATDSVDVSGSTIALDTPTLNSILGATYKVDDDATQAALDSILTQLSSGGIIIGTEDGTITGTQRAFVNNVYLQILAAKDRDQDISYADFGTKDQRITQIDYTAPSIGTGSGFTARKTFTYVLDGGRYKRTKITRLLV